MQKRYQKVLSAGLLAVVLFSVSASAAAQSAANSASAEEWTEVRTSSRGNLVVGDGSAVSIRSEDIQELAGNLNVLGSDFKASKKDLGSRLSSAEDEIGKMKTSFQAGVNSIAEALKTLGYTPAGYDPGNPAPESIVAAIHSLSEGKYNAGYAACLSEGAGNLDPMSVLTGYVLIKTYVSYHQDGDLHSYDVVQRVTAYEIHKEGKLGVYSTEVNGEFHKREGFYSISSQCTTKYNNWCHYKDGCLLPDTELVEVRLLRSARVRLITRYGFEEREYKEGETFRLRDEEAFLML